MTDTEAATDAQVAEAQSGLEDWDNTALRVLARKLAVLVEQEQQNYESLLEHHEAETADYNEWKDRAERAEAWVEKAVPTLESARDLARPIESDRAADVYADADDLITEAEAILKESGKGE